MRHRPGSDFGELGAGALSRATASTSPRQKILRLESGPFDIVYCSEVIEHCPDVNRFMASIVALMAPGGMLFLTTPDISHWRRPRDIAEWDAFVPPEHCLYFNPSNLALLLTKHDLHIVRRRLALKPGIKVLARRDAK